MLCTLFQYQLIFGVFPLTIENILHKVADFVIGVPASESYVKLLSVLQNNNCFHNYLPSFVDVYSLYSVPTIASSCLEMTNIILLIDDICLLLNPSFNINRYFLHCLVQEFFTHRKGLAQVNIPINIKAFNMNCMWSCFLIWMRSNQHTSKMFTAFICNNARPNFQPFPIE